MLEGPVEHVRGGAETMRVDMGRPRPGGDFFDVAVGYRRPAEARRRRLSVPPGKQPR